MLKPITRTSRESAKSWAILKSTPKPYTKWNMRLRKKYFCRKFKDLSLKILLCIVFMLIHSFAFSAESVRERTVTDMDKSEKTSGDITGKRFASCENYIKIKIKDIGTGKSLNMIIDNYILASFMAAKHGFKIDKLGRFIDVEAARHFIENDYVRYMINMKDETIEINLSDLEKFIGRAPVGEGAYKDLKKYIYEHYILIFENPMSFDELGVNSEEELIKKFFDSDSKTRLLTLKQQYLETYNLNPSFIALLIDIGYFVGHTDVVPILFIRK